MSGTGTSHPAGRRRLDASVPVEYDLPVRKPRIGSRATARRLGLLVAAAWLLGFVGSLMSIVAVETPDVLHRPAAALLTLALVVAVTHRGGGHLRLWVPLIGGLCVLAATVQAAMLLSAAACVTGVLAAVWAVIVTQPAVTVPEVVKEYAIGLTAAVSGAVGVAAWNATVTVQAFNFVVVGASLALVISLVWGLGAGLHGLGRLHLAGLVGIAALLFALIAYSSFVRTHGSETLTDALDELVYWLRSTINGVPRPVEVFLGFPALVVGIAMRSQRREGWWVLVFAVIGTAAMTTSMVSPNAYPTYISLSTLYSAILGLGLGLAARHFVVSSGASRSSRVVQPQLRAEPARFSPLK